MATNDIDIFQDFCKRWINKAVNKHFKDVTATSDNSLSLGVARQAIKRVCLHKDSDNMTLTIGRLLIWWVEARGLFNEIIYGIPSDTFHETVRFQPQIKLFWRESAKDAETNGRYPARARYTIRYKGNVSTKQNIEALKTKINTIFNSPNPHYFVKGRNKYSYRDKEKGYEFVITARDKTEAGSVINNLLEIQGDNPLNEALLTTSTSERSWTTTETVKVGGNNYTKPKARPVAKVYFTHAELAVHGMTQDITLVNNLGVRVPTKLD